MLLFEVFDTPKVESKWTDFVQALVDKYGLQKFTGNQATVLSSRDRTSVYRIWSKDPGFEKWLSYVQQHQDNPYVVKVLSKVHVVQTQFKSMPSDVKLKIVKLEKLTPISDQHFWNALDTVVAEQPVADFEQFKNSIEQAYSNVKPVIDKYEPFFRFVHQLMVFGANDLNSENVMMRGNVPVVTDPFSGH